MAVLIPATDLPDGFAYPVEYLRVVDLGIASGLAPPLHSRTSFDFE
jgi:hypothetical protein